MLGNLRQVRRTKHDRARAFQIGKRHIAEQVRIVLEGMGRMIGNLDSVPAEQSLEQTIGVGIDMLDAGDPVPQARETRTESMRWLPCPRRNRRRSHPVQPLPSSPRRRRRSGFAPGCRSIDPFCRPLRSSKASKLSEREQGGLVDRWRHRSGIGTVGGREDRRHVQSIDVVSQGPALS